MFALDMLASILLAIPGLALIWVLVAYLEHLISLRKYPKGPFPLPLVGNLLMLSKKPHLDFIEFGKVYGDVFSISLGMKRMVIVNSYSNIKEALITRGTDFAGRPTDNIVIRIPSNNFTSIISFDYSKSFTFVRKLAYKSLHLYGTGMRNIEDIVTEEVEKMCSILSKETDKPIVIRKYLGNSLVNTICHLCFSKKYHSNDPEFQQILESMRMIIQGTAPGQAISVFPWLQYLPHTRRFRELVKGSKKRDAITHKFFEEHIQTFNPEKLRDLTDNLLYLSQNKEMWKDAGFEKVTQIQLESIVNAIFIAGIETSLSTIRWMLIYLLHNPEVQTKIYQEVSQKLGLKHQITTDDMASLPYVQAVLHETNRYASILPLSLPHKTTVNTSVAGLSVPKGTQVFFNLYNMHHDSVHWDEPEKFKPDRWLNPDGSLKKEKITHYLPFSTGTRVCLGERLAKMQMFLMVTKLFLNFEVKIAPGEQVPDMKDGNIGMTLEPKEDFKVILKCRKH